MTHLQDLPVVITCPGIYRMRSGSEVRIYHFDFRNLFSAKGYRRDTHVAIRGRYPNNWHVSGKFVPVGDSQSDIIERVSE